MTDEQGDSESSATTGTGGGPRPPSDSDGSATTGTGGGSRPPSGGGRGAPPPGGDESSDSGWFERIETVLEHAMDLAKLIWKFAHAPVKHVAVPVLTSSIGFGGGYYGLTVVKEYHLVEAGTLDVGEIRKTMQTQIRALREDLGCPPDSETGARCVVPTTVDAVAVERTVRETVEAYLRDNPIIIDKSKVEEAAGRGVQVSLKDHPVVVDTMVVKQAAQDGVKTYLDHNAFTFDETKVEEAAGRGVQAYLEKHSIAINANIDAETRNEIDNTYKAVVHPEVSHKAILARLNGTDGPKTSSMCESLPPYRFATGSARLKKDEAGQTDRLAKRLLAGDVNAIYLTGHADRQGNAACNIALSAYRLDAVLRALAVALKDRGVEIKTSAYGETPTYLPVPTADGLKEPENRSVRIVVEKVN